MYCVQRIVWGKHVKFTIFPVWNGRDVRASDNLPSVRSSRQTTSHSAGPAALPGTYESTLEKQQQKTEKQKTLALNNNKITVGVRPFDFDIAIPLDCFCIIYQLSFYFFMFLFNSYTTCKGLNNILAFVQVLVLGKRFIQNCERGVEGGTKRKFLLVGHFYSTWWKDCSFHWCWHPLHTAPSLLSKDNPKHISLSPKVNRKTQTFQKIKSPKTKVPWFN